MAALEILALDTGVPRIRAPGTGNTYSAPRALALSPESLTGSSATSSLEITQTWNTTGLPTALKVSVTDTASNANSLLLDLRTGGTSMFSITKFGQLTVNAGGFFCSSATGYRLYASDYSVVFLVPETANGFGIRNGTNGQLFRTYGTFTNSSNYRRVALAMTSAGVATLAPEGAGTGASGNVLHISGLPTSNPGAGILWNNAGTPAIGT